MDAFRAINEMVFALLFIVAVGLGPFAGVLALFVHTTGSLAKLFSEAVEAVDHRPVEGIRVTGSHQIAEIIFGIIPQVCPCGFPTYYIVLNQMLDLPQLLEWSVLAV